MLRIFLFLTFVAGILTGESNVYFDCRRNGQDCKRDNSCKDADGMCSCDGRSVGIDCSVASGLAGAAECANMQDPCGTEGGICYSASSVTIACSCPPDTYGVGCKEKRIQVKCSEDSMEMTVVLLGTFDGVMYIEGQRNVEDCQFTKKWKDGFAQYSLNVSDTACGELVKTTNSRSRDFIIQFNSKYLTTYDVKVTVSCTRDDISTVRVSKKLDNIQSEGHIKSSGVNNTVPTEVKFEIKKEDGSVVSGPVSLSDRLTFEFTAVKGFYQKIRLESCTSTNGLTGNDLESMSIITDGCPEENLGKLWKQKPNLLTNVSISFQLQAFKFNNAPSVEMTCNLKLCSAGKTLFCNPDSCGERNRKRRSTENSDVTVKKTFVIEFYEDTKPSGSLEDKNVDKGQGETSGNKSSPESQIIIPMVVGVAIATLLIVLIIVFTVVLLRKRQRKENCEN